MINSNIVSEAAELRFTGERFMCDPTLLHSQIYYEHLHRYLFAAECVRGDVVLDIACGEGYGSNLLAQRAASVTGIDLSAETVAHAARKYQRANLKFLTGECRSIPLESATVDVVVSFETIEHLEEHDVFIREVRRVLKPGGRLIISSPDRDEYGARGVAENSFHKKEVSRDEFRELLQKQFRHVVLLDQKLVAGSYLASSSGNDIAASQIVGIFKGGWDAGGFAPGGPKGLYLVAVCSDKAPPALPVGIFEHAEISAQIWNAFEILPDLRKAQAAALAKLAELEGAPSNSGGVETGGAESVAHLKSRIASLESEVEKRGHWGMSLNTELETLRETLKNHVNELESGRQDFRFRMVQKQDELRGARAEILELTEQLQRRGRELDALLAMRLQAEAQVQAERLTAETQRASILAAHEQERRELRGQLQLAELSYAKQRQQSEALEISLVTWRGEVERKHAATLDLTSRLAAAAFEADRVGVSARDEAMALREQAQRQSQRAIEDSARYEEQLAAAQQQLAMALKETQQLMTRVRGAEADVTWDRAQLERWQQSDHTLRQMKSSWSWRITAPLRKFQQLLRDPLLRRRH